MEKGRFVRTSKISFIVANIILYFTHATVLDILRHQLAQKCLCDNSRSHSLHVVLFVVCSKCKPCGELAFTFTVLVSHNNESTYTLSKADLTMIAKQPHLAASSPTAIMENWDDLLRTAKRAWPRINFFSFAGTLRTSPDTAAETAIKGNSLPIISFENYCIFELDSLCTVQYISVLKSCTVNTGLTTCAVTLIHRVDYMYCNLNTQG